MALLALACGAFLLTHLGVSSTPLRGQLVTHVGDTAYLGLYSLVSFATLGLMIYAYANVSHAEQLWAPGVAATVFAKLLMPFALLLLIGGLMVKNPTAVGQESALGEQPGAIIRITRHPVQWGILLWAVSHVMANGDQASILFFTTMAVLSSLGMLAMDAKRRARNDPAWQAFFAQTSYVPFVALATGRTSLKLSELNWLAIGIGAFLYVVLYVFHDWVSGVPLMLR